MKKWIAQNLATLTQQLNKNVEHVVTYNEPWPENNTLLPDTFPYAGSSVATCKVTQARQSVSHNKEVGKAP